MYTYVTSDFLFLSGAKDLKQIIFTSHSQNLM